jgi:hypothetical protein
MKRTIVDFFLNQLRMPPKQIIIFCLNPDKAAPDANPILGGDDANPRPASAATTSTTTSSSSSSIGTLSVSSLSESKLATHSSFDKIKAKDAKSASKAIDALMRRKPGRPKGSVNRNSSEKKEKRKKQRKKKRGNADGTVTVDGDDDDENGKETDADGNDNASYSSGDDLELCEKCKREGEVLECDWEGCDLLWHVACVRELKGKVPEGRWICPGPHDERCAVCQGEGDVVLCDVKNCGRMYHIKCLPFLKNVVPKGFWECPQCIAEREADLRCAVCLVQNKEGGDDNLVKCTACGEAVHLGCLSAYGARADITCSTCNYREMSRSSKKARISTVRVRVEFSPKTTLIDQARVAQIIRGEATGLTNEEAKAFLDSCIAKRMKTS